MFTLKALTLCCACLFTVGNSQAQEIDNTNCVKPATVILFRTFNLFSFKFSYNLFAGDSLLGRIKTYDVFFLETYDNGVSFHATTKAPSLNAGKTTNYSNTKTIKYPFSLQPGQVYFVKCDFLNQRLFDYPRQPTIRLIKRDEIRKFLKKRFVKKKVTAFLYQQWLTEKGLTKYTQKN